MRVTMSRASGSHRRFMKGSSAGSATAAASSAATMCRRQAVTKDAVGT